MAPTGNKAKCFSSVNHTTKTIHHHSRVRSTRYSDRLHDFSVTISNCHKDVYVNSFFPCTARLRNYLPAECFPLTYDLNGFNFIINRELFNCRFFLNRFSICFNLFLLIFLVT